MAQYGIRLGGKLYLPAYICVSGLPAVITMAPTATDLDNCGVPLEDICRQLEEAGAACVGINCLRGPESMRRLIKKVRAACKVNLKHLLNGKESE